MPLRILLVDDDQRFRAAARRALVADGAEVVAELEDGAGVVAAIAAWRPEVVLLDIGLPGISGVLVARHLREVEDDVVVILISTRDVAHGRRVAEGVASGYLRKDQLSLAAILQLLGRAA